MLPPVGEKSLRFLKYFAVESLAGGVHLSEVRGVARAQGHDATFMAKPHHGQAGSSCHIHLSLRKDGRNAFAERPGETAILIDGAAWIVTATNPG